MNIFNIIGPVMVGPSSSHTAGAVRIGNVCRKLLGEKVRKADIYFHGSFRRTGRGHGTDRAHPNSVKLDLESVSGRKLSIVASSVGGGSILINEIDGLSANFSGELPTLIVHNLDQPGHVAEVTSMLQHKSVNIATMQLYRSGRGGHAVMVIECDQEVPEESLDWLKHLEGVEKVTYYSLSED